jgi:hypothetical protein
MVQNKNISQATNMMVLYDEIPLHTGLINHQDDAPKIVLGNMPDQNSHLTPLIYIILELQNLHLHHYL